MPKIISVPLCELYGKVVCKFNPKKLKLKDDEGQYPRLHWKHNTGKKIGNKDIKYRIIPITESPQHKYILGEKDYYQQYMTITGWNSGYGRERRRAIRNFDKLITTFDKYLGKGNENNYIECVKQNDKYVIVDGLHRASIIYSKAEDEKTQIKVKIIRCSQFTNLPM